MDAGSLKVLGILRTTAIACSNKAVSTSPSTSGVTYCNSFGRTANVIASDAMSAASANLPVPVLVAAVCIVGGRESAFSHAGGSSIVSVVAAL